MTDVIRRVALVTGASRGLGRAMALALARSHVRVVVNLHSRSTEASEVESEVRAFGGETIALRADVSMPGEVEMLVRDSEARLGPIDILVNNAGIARPQSIEEVTERDLG
jgi:3-oxoacyl-[acyl-carrier protein] reductase